jgi:dihydroxyacid dehydratase/phosphogluconate dehydratase
LRDGDIVSLRVDTRGLEGRVEVISTTPTDLAARIVHPDLKPDPRVPADTRLWAALQQASGGSWCGCVYDSERIIRLLEMGHAAEIAQAKKT